jgi:hypothetical protein
MELLIMVTPTSFFFSAERPATAALVSYTSFLLL